MSSELVRDVVRDAYVYAYPLVLGDLTMRQVTNVSEPRQPYGPMGVFAHARVLPGPEFQVVIRPNVDTLYSSAYLDLGAEPVVLTAPGTDRYYVLPIYDLWTNVFAVPGSRTTGGVEKHFLLTPPGWSGSVPEGVEQIAAPTRFVSIIGRTQVNGQDDLPSVHAVQDAMALTPFSVWQGSGEPRVPGPVDASLDMRTPPPDLVAGMSAEVFFREFSRVLADNPASPYDYPILHRLARIGLTRANGFDVTTLEPALPAAAEEGVAAGRAAIVAEYDRLNGEGARGWTYSTEGGSYGVNYTLRAGVAAWGLGMNLPDDAVYLSVATDSEDEPLNGNSSYALRFEAESLPPAEAFWSVTVYDDHGFLIENTLARYALGDRSDIPLNPDGSTEILLQADDPGGSDTAKWLPTGSGAFNLMLRLYSPSRRILGGDWTPPLVERV